MRKVKPGAKRKPGPVLHAMRLQPVKVSNFHHWKVQIAGRLYTTEVSLGARQWTLVDVTDLSRTYRHPYGRLRRAITSWLPRM